MRLNVAMDLVRISRALQRRVSALSFDDPVACVYDPLDYARDNHEAYLHRFGRVGVEALLVGMNPGPFGMVQTGVPFGEVAAVREFLGITGAVRRPAREHAKRPVLGLECKRSEVSGRRIWDWARERFGNPEAFSERFFLWNYCPLAFVEESGRNRTPDKLPPHEREPLFAACDEALVRAVLHLKPRYVIGIGAFARDRARNALAGTAAAHVQLGTLLHPSPASPLANRGWAAQAEQQLAELGIALPTPSKR